MPIKIKKNWLHREKKSYELQNKKNKKFYHWNFFPTTKVGWGGIKSL